MRFAEEDFDPQSAQWRVIESIALGTVHVSIGLYGQNAYGASLSQRPRIHEALNG